MKREFVVSCYTFSPDQKVLLIHHRKLGMWLPPGGHVEENELPHEAALREIFEETGLAVELISSDHLHVDEWNARTIPRPELVLLENIPEWKETPFHQHIDMVYIAKGPIEDMEGNILSASGSEKSRWFSLSEIEALIPDKDIFQETKLVLKYLFTKYSGNTL